MSPQKSNSANPNTQRMNIPGDMVQSAMTRLVEQGEIDDAAKLDLWWFYSYAMDRGWTLEDAGKAIAKDGTTAYRLFVGRYGARYDNLIEAIRRYRKLAEARGARKKLGFVETTTWECIDKVCRHALVGQLPAFIFGASQIGKTKCLEEFSRRNNHGQTRYVRMPATPTLLQAQQEVAKACYISAKCAPNTLRDRIFGAITDQMLLIVDEMHQPLLPGCRETTALRIIEWLREVYDRRNCGIVFVGTKVFRDEIETGKLSLVLEQFRRRGIIQATLPDIPPKADVAKIAHAFGLEPPSDQAADIVAAMLKGSGLGQYVKFLQSASNLAVNQKKELSWDHFVQSHDLVQALSTPQPQTKQ